MVLFNKTHVEIKDTKFFQLIIAYCKDLSIINTSINYVLVYRSRNIEMRNISLRSDGLSLGIIDSSGLDLYESSIVGADIGIYIFNSSIIRVDGCYFEGGNKYALFVEHTYGFEISCCTFDKTVFPIKMENSSSITISNNHILCGYTWNESRIVLSWCTNITMSGNIIEDTRLGAINIEDSSDIHIFNNNLTNMFIYIYVMENSEIEIENNKINGLPLLFYKTIRDKRFSNIVAGQILLLSCSNINLSNISSYSIHLASSNNISVERSVLHESAIGLNIYDCDKIIISGCNISSCIVGIFVDASSNISIEYSNISNHIIYGTLFRRSMRVIFVGCRVNKNDYGLYYTHSAKIFILNSSVSLNTFEGIAIRDSDIVQIIGNIISLNGWGIALYDSYNIHMAKNSLVFDAIHIFDRPYTYKNITITSDNRVNGQPIHYLYGLHDKKITEISGQVFIIECSNLTIESSSNSEISIYRSKKIKLIGTNIFGGDEGVTIIGSRDIYLSNVFTYNNSCGIHIIGSANISLNNCRIECNENGIIVVSSNYISFEYINITTNKYGLSIYKSSMVKVSGILIKSSNYGVSLSRSKNITISSAKMDTDIYAIILNSTFLAYIDKVEMMNPCMLGISVHESAILIVEKANIVAQEKCLGINMTSYVWVAYNTFTGANIGIETTHSASISIIKNTIIGNHIGLRIDKSYDIIVTDNKIYSSDIPIQIEFSKVEIYDNDFGDHKIGLKLIAITGFLGAIYWLFYMLLDMGIIKRLRGLFRKC